MKKSNLFCNLKQNRTEQPSFQCLFRLVLLFQLWNIRVKFTSLSFSSLVCSVASEVCACVWDPAELLVQLVMARGVLATFLPETRHSFWQDAPGPVLCAPAHSWLSCCMRSGIFLFLKLWTQALLADIHEASLGKHFLRVGTHISGSGPGQPWRVNEEKQDSSMKEGNKPEDLSRWKVFKSLWVYVLS